MWCRVNTDAHSSIGVSRGTLRCEPDHGYVFVAQKPKPQSIPLSHPSWFATSNEIPKGFMGQTP